MARASNKQSTTPTKKNPGTAGPKKARKPANKRPPRLTVNRGRDTTDILHGRMQDTIREAFLKRP